jgi:hypothetical protein
MAAATWQHRQARATHIIKQQDGAVDLVVLGGAVEHAQYVAQLRTLFSVTLCFSEQGFAGIAGMLFNQRAFEIENQRGLVFQL